MVQNSWRHSRCSIWTSTSFYRRKYGLSSRYRLKGFWQLDSKLFDISKPKVSNIVSCQIRINDGGGASRSKQPLQRAHGQHRRMPLMVFWCQYAGIVFPQCLLVVLIQQNLSAIFFKQINQIPDNVEQFKYFRLVGELKKSEIRWWNM